MSQLKVISYNLFYNKAGKHVIQLVNEIKPDIVCMQETFPTDPFINKLKNLNYKIAAKAPSFQKFGNDYYIFTFYNPKTVKFSNYNYLNFPRSIYERFLYLLKKAPFPRSFTLSFFSKNKKTFAVFNVHLSPWSTDGEKIKQIRRLFEETKKVSPPIVITGDFNYPYGKRRFENLLKEYNFKEATKNITFTQEAKVFKILPIRLKLDYILYKGLKHSKTVRLPRNGSDHYPILAFFEL